MKTSHHTYGTDKGFCIKEAYFELISHFIVLAFKEFGLNNKPEWYLSVYDDFLDISKGHVQGYAYLTLEDELKFILEREQLIIEVLEASIKTIQSCELTISVEELNKIEIENKDWGADTRVEWFKDIKTSDLIYVIQIFIKMLKHDWDKDIDIRWPITHKAI